MSRLSVIREYGNMGQFLLGQFYNYLILPLFMPPHPPTQYKWSKHSFLNEQCTRLDNFISFLSKSIPIPHSTVEFFFINVMDSCEFWFHRFWCIMKITKFKLLQKLGCIQLSFTLVLRHPYVCVNSSSIMLWPFGYSLRPHYGIKFFMGIKKNLLRITTAKQQGQGNLGKQCSPWEIVTDIYWSMFDLVTLTLDMRMLFWRRSRSKS